MSNTTGIDATTMPDARTSERHPSAPACRVPALASRTDQPQELGLIASARRRAPGLLREEVAQAAGMSATWYTWMEQARPINPSVRVLAGLARTLRLDAAGARTSSSSPVPISVRPRSRSQPVSSANRSSPRLTGSPRTRPTSPMPGSTSSPGTSRPRALLGDFGAGNRSAQSHPSSLHRTGIGGRSS